MPDATHNEEFRILWVGRPDRFAEATRSALKRLGSTRMIDADSVATALDRADGAIEAGAVAPDVPGGPKQATLDLLEKHPEIPVIVRVRPDEASIGVECIRCGAAMISIDDPDAPDLTAMLLLAKLSDLQKERRYNRIENQLDRMVVELFDRAQQLEHMTRQLETRAAIDSLTGLANRGSFDEALIRAFSEAERYGGDLACVMLDLDGFKPYNDTFGHQAGDKMLQIVASILRSCCRKSDIAARYGGDEFVMLMPRTTDRDAGMVARRIISRLARTIDRTAADASGVTISAGTASLANSGAPTAAKLLRCADEALYAAKQSGKAREMIYGQNEARSGKASS